MAFIAGESLARRTVLKGMGAAVALPVLDSMLPALTAQTAPTPRLGFVYVSHGLIFDQWKPAKIDKDFGLTPNLKLLEKVNGQFNVLTGLSHLEADTKGDGSGGHTRAAAAWPTGIHAYDRTRPGVEVKLATTADQIAAHTLGENSPIPSLEMTVDTASQGSCDSGDWFDVNTISSRNETTPNLISHHRDDKELVSQKARIDTYHVQMLACLREKMGDGDDSLLDHSLYGSGNLHSRTDLPVLLGGKLGGKCQTGYRYDYKMDTPMANLLAPMLDRAGVPIEKLGGSTGPLKWEIL